MKAINFKLLYFYIKVKISIKWYKIVADKLDSWNQEKFCACLSLGELYRREQDFENSIKFT